jgi:hypothetical protein
MLAAGKRGIAPDKVRLNKSYGTLTRRLLMLCAALLG